MSNNLNIDWSDLNELAYSKNAFEIAQIKGCSQTTVRRALRRFGINHHNGRLRTTQATLDKIKELYNSNLSSYDIARYLELPSSTVRKYVREMGIQRSISKAVILQNRRKEQQNNCPHQFTIRVDGGYACLICKKRFML